MAFFARPSSSSAVRIVDPSSQDDKTKPQLRKGVFVLIIIQSSMSSIIFRRHPASMQKYLDLRVRLGAETAFQS